MASLCQSNRSIIENLDTSKSITNDTDARLHYNGSSGGHTNGSSSSSSTTSSPTSSSTTSDGKILKEDAFECVSRNHDLYRLTLTSSHLLLQLAQSPYTVDKLSFNDLFGCHTFRHKDSVNNIGAYICFFFYIKRKKGFFISSAIKIPPSSSSSSFSSSSSSSDHSSGSMVAAGCPKEKAAHSKYFREKTPFVFHIKKLGNKFSDNLEIATSWKDAILGLLRTRFSKWQLEKLGHVSDEVGQNGNVDNSNNSKNSHGFPFSPSQLPTYSSGKRMSVDNNNGRKERKNSNSNNNQANELDELSLAITTYRSLQRKFLVILNPKSGQGKTMTLFQEKVHPILIEGGIKVMLLITERPGHARSMVSSADLSDIDGIATVGGDGLLYEVVNGLRSRADSHKYADIPLGVIAGGSGNGLARSIAAYSGEDQDYLHSPVIESTLAIAKGKVIPVNLAEVELDGRKIYSFLSVGWGLLADIDIESEVLRGIGEIRFFLWSFLRLAKLRTYSAQLSYIPYSTSSPNNTPTSNTLPKQPENQRVTIDGNFISVYSSVQSHIGTDMTFAPSAKYNDGLIHLTIVRGNVGRTRTTQFLLGLDKGEHLGVTGCEYVPVKEFSLRNVGGIAGTVTIDGERVTGEHLKVRISPKPLNVFSL